MILTATLIPSTQVPSTQPPKCELNPYDTNEHAKLDRKKAHEVSTLQKNYSQLRKAGNDGDSFLKEDHKIWLSNSNGQHCKKNTYKQHYMDKHVIFRNIYVHALTILEERGHEFKGQWGRVYWRD